MVFITYIVRRELMLDDKTLHFIDNCISITKLTLVTYLLIAVGIMFQPTQYPTFPSIIFMVVVGAFLLFVYQIILGYGSAKYKQLSNDDKIKFYNYTIRRIFNVLVEHSYYGLLISIFNLFAYKKTIAVGLSFIFAVMILVFWILGDRLIKDI
jgi:hypothetical protein